MAIIIVTATKNATTKERGYPAVIFLGGGIKKRKGRLCLHPIPHRSSHADPSFRPRREPSSRSGFSLFIRWLSKQPANLEAGRGVGATPPDNRLARFSAIFHITKSGNCPLRYRNFAEFFGFLKKS